MKKANSIQKRELYLMVLRDCRYVRVHKGCKTGCAGIPQGQIPADVGAASDLLKPYDARMMRCYSISTRNSVANDDAERCTLWPPVGNQDQLIFPQWFVVLLQRSG
jgi:hypothetical protein